MADLRSILFVSRSLIPPQDERREIQAILEKGTFRNASLAVTGALVFTGQHFAEVLEGEGRALEELLSLIRQDPRHCDLTIIDMLRLPDRTFTRWAMAYQGPSTYVSQHVAPLLNRPCPHVARALRTFMRGMID